MQKYNENNENVMKNNIMKNANLYKPIQKNHTGCWNISGTFSSI